jgi:hypothetical protein
MLRSIHCGNFRRAQQQQLYSGQSAVPNNNPFNTPANPNPGGKGTDEPSPETQKLNDLHAGLSSEPPSCGDAERFVNLFSPRPVHQPSFEGMISTPVVHSSDPLQPLSPLLRSAWAKNVECPPSDLASQDLQERDHTAQDLPPRGHPAGTQAYILALVVGTNPNMCRFVFEDGNIGSDLPLQDAIAQLVSGGEASTRAFQEFTRASFLSSPCTMVINADGNTRVSLVGICLLHGADMKISREDYRENVWTIKFNHPKLHNGE